MADQPEGTLRLAEAAKRCGVPVDVLKRLIESGHINSGVVRARSGHAYLREDALPEWADVVELLEHRLRHHIGKARETTRRAIAELEAVVNDLAEAEQHPLDPLGLDLEAFNPYSRHARDKSFAALLERLLFDTGDVLAYSEALRKAHKVP